MTMINRNPFAREELHRETVETSHSCDFCGMKRQSGKLFEYRIETDGGRSFDIKGSFCSVECMRTYHT